MLNLKDVYDPNFLGETFRVLKEKEEKQYGEYRTRRLVSEAWDRLEAKWLFVNKPPSQIGIFSICIVT